MNVWILLGRVRRRFCRSVPGVVMAVLIAHAAAWAASPPTPGQRILVLGDSITYSGQYAADVEAYWAVHHPDCPLKIYNLGLPSETVSGLSEPGHAGGAFPRPDLHERLERVLRALQPDVVLACYGMNDGIYYPYSHDRFEAFCAGIERLREAVTSKGARLIHLTPPAFDPAPILKNTLPAGQEEYRRPYVGYNEVLDLYAAWLVANRANGWEVIDVHGPINRFLRERRQTDPNARLASDGVHLDDLGHWLIAREILAYWDSGASVPSWDRADAVWQSEPRAKELLPAIREKQRLLSDAWLTQTGHRRPGMAKGLPADEAERKAAEMDRKIQQALTGSK